MSVVDVDEETLELPPGFRFHPTDEEIITHYLSPKVINPSFTSRAVGDVDLNKCEPWDLPSKAKMGEKEWYFFFQRDRKYPTGMRTNRATESGYWKTTGKDREIFKGRGVLVGMKKTLVFYKGRAPKGEKTNWVMHEYRIEGKSSLPKQAGDEWVVCRVFHKNIGLKRTQIGATMDSSMGSLDEFFDSTNLPALMEPQYLINSNMMPATSSTFFNNKNETLDIKEMPSNFSTLPARGKSQQLLVNNQLSPIQPQNNLGTFYPQVSNYYSNPGMENLSYLQQPWLQVYETTLNDSSNAVRRHCKVEQYSSNQSIGCPSQDTGLSTDHNTEISSVVSTRFNDGFIDPSSLVGITDMENFWRV